MAKPVIPTDHEKAEWARLANAAYAANINAIGHRYSTAAALGSNCEMPRRSFDELQRGYQLWLSRGFDPFFKQEIEL